MCDLEEQDEIKELAIKWLLESDYVIRVIEGMVTAHGHIIRRQELKWEGSVMQQATVNMQVQLRQGAESHEAQALIDFLDRLTQHPVHYGMEPNDRGHGFVSEPSLLTFEVVVPSKKRIVPHERRYRI